MEQDKERLPRKDQSSYPDNMRRKKRKETKEKKLLILNVRLTGIQTDRMTTRQITNRYMKRQTGKIGSNSDYSERYTDDNICMQKDRKNADGSAKKRTITENKKKKTNTQTNSHTGRQRDKRAHDRTDTKTDRRTREHRKLNR